MEEVEGNVGPLLSGGGGGVGSRVGLMVKLAFSLGHILNDMCASMWFTYLLIFFHSVLQFDNTYAGVILLAGQIADGLSTLFVGFFLDSGDDMWLCNNYGKRKSWHLIGTFCVMVSFPFIFMPCLGCADVSQDTQLVYFIAFVVIFQFGWAATQISHLSMIPVLSGCELERTSLTSKRYAATVLSNLAVFCVTWAWLGIGGSSSHQEGISRSIGPCDKTTFQNVAAICLGVGGLASLLFHLTVKIPEDNVVSSPTTTEDDRRALVTNQMDTTFENEDQEEVPDTDLPVRPNGAVVVEQRYVAPMSVKNWLCEPQFYQVALVYMATRLFVNVSQSYIPFYLQETIKLEATSVAIIPLIMFVSGFVVSWLNKAITKIIGRKMAFALGCVIALAGCLWVHFGPIDDPSYTTYQIYPVAVLIGAAGSQMLITSLCITADLIGNNLDSSAFIYGCMSLVDKFSNGLAIMVIQKNIPAPCGAPDEGNYFKLILSWVCGGAAVLGIVSVATLLPVKIGQRRRDKRQAEQIPEAAVSETSESHNSSEIPT